MPDTIEAAAVLAVVIMPGFVGFHITRELSPNLRHDESDAELLFSSLGFAGVLLAVEFLVLASLAAVFPHLAVFGGATVGELRGDGFSQTLSQYPSRVVIVASLEFLLHCALVALLGWKDPFGAALANARTKRGFSAVDPWTLGLGGLRRDFGSKATWVRVTLSNGVVYTGYLSKISNRPREDGTRDLVLQAFMRADAEDRTFRPLDPVVPERTVVALNTKDVVSVEGLFTDAYVPTTER